MVEFKVKYIDYFLVFFFCLEIVLLSYFLTFVNILKEYILQCNHM